MVMNHRKAVDEAFIEYTVTVDDDPEIEPVTPYWFDSRNCRSDPIYNVKGHGGKGSTDNEKTTFTMPEAGRIIAGGGHTHGGARKLDADSARLRRPQRSASRCRPGATRTIPSTTSNRSCTNPGRST